MRYCTNCVIPATRPEIVFGDDGICSACRFHRVAREQVDWGARREQFEEVVGRGKAKGAVYDCVVPVSGGKDSTWQTVTCLEHGLRPLCVTWRTPGRTAIGQRNLDNLIGLGVEHIDFSVSPKVERKFLLAALERHGTTAIPMHLAIFNIPLLIAVRFGVPLMVWGENSAAEYIGSGSDAETPVLTREWVRRYGAVKGTSAADWISNELSAGELAPYFGPSDEELAATGVEAVFLGHFLGWDPAATASVAARHGFATANDPKTGIYDYADIDDDFISIHHYLKWFKFGFTRSYDNLSLEIRNGRITREEAVDRLRALGDETPWGDIERFCAYVGITRTRFFEIAEAFRDPAVWSRRADGTWLIEDFLLEDWDWSASPAAPVAVG